MTAVVPDSAVGPEKRDFWGDVFDLTATTVVIFGWIGLAGLTLWLALIGGTMLLGKTVSFRMEGPVLVLTIAAAFPLFSIVVARRLRRHARTSVPARAGIAALFAVYAVFAALRMFD